jgi:hypothetical protein
MIELPQPMVEAEAEAAVFYEHALQQRQQPGQGQWPIDEVGKLRQEQERILEQFKKEAEHDFTETEMDQNVINDVEGM